MILRDEQTGERYEADQIKKVFGVDTKVCGAYYLKPLDTKEEWPTAGEWYWYVGEDSIVDYHLWHNYKSEMRVKDFTGVFKTKQEAEQARDRIASIKDAVVTHCQAIKNGYLDNDLPQQAEVKLFIDVKYLKAWEALE